MRKWISPYLIHEIFRVWGFALSFWTFGLDSAVLKMLRCWPMPVQVTPHDPTVSGPPLLPVFSLVKLCSFYYHGSGGNCALITGRTWEGSSNRDTKIRPHPFEFHNVLLGNRCKPSIWPTFRGKRNQQLFLWRNAWSPSPPTQHLGPWELEVQAKKAFPPLV